MQWFIDFDDTLTIAPSTWAIQSVLPRLIRQHQLPYTDELLYEALLRSQQLAALAFDETQFMDTLFRLMGWSAAMKDLLRKEVDEHYMPMLFEDARPFLQRMKAAGQRVYIVANNNQSPQIAQALGIAVYIDDIFTPQRCGAARGKPHREMWDFIAEHVASDQTIMVGDDPWCDGAFADACELTCVLVDRWDRYAHLSRYYRCLSLSEIEPVSAL
jgi:FMN phosphatase YigB (HAD superfamily)